jgi:D-alanyl-D-alanine endopeptidase (penicillin-binding protein 7)
MVLFTSKRFEIVWLVLLFLCGYMSGATAQAEPKLTAKQAYVVNLDTGEVVLNKNENEAAPIASITKLMTALVTVSSGLDMEEQITITDDELTATKESRRHIGIPVGATYARGELLLLALMSSSNRAAAALARTHPAGFDGFIELMNVKARELEMTNTHFVDPTGLYNENKSTPEDLVKLLRVVMNHPEIGRLSTETLYSKSYQVEQKTKVTVQNKKTKQPVTRWVTRTVEVTRHYGTTNRLVLTDDWSIYLQKTGFIRAAGYCMVMVLNVNGVNYAMVMLNNANARTRALDAVKTKYWIEYRDIPSRKELTKLDPFKPAPRKR